MSDVYCKVSGNSKFIIVRKNVYLIVIFKMFIFYHKQEINALEITIKILRFLGSLGWISVNTYTSKKNL